MPKCGEFLRWRLESHRSEQGDLSGQVRFGRLANANSQTKKGGYAVTHVTHDKRDLERILSQLENPDDRNLVAGWFVNSHAISEEFDPELLQRVEQVRNAMNEYLKGIL